MLKYAGHASLLLDALLLEHRLVVSHELLLHRHHRGVSDTSWEQRKVQLRTSTLAPLEGSLPCHLAGFVGGSAGCLASFFSRSSFWLWAASLSARCVSHWVPQNEHRFTNALARERLSCESRSTCEFFWPSSYRRSWMATARACQYALSRGLEQRRHTHERCSSSGRRRPCLHHVENFGVARREVRQQRGRVRRERGGGGEGLTGLCVRVR